MVGFVGNFGVCGIRDGVVKRDGWICGRRVRSSSLSLASASALSSRVLMMSSMEEKDGGEGRRMGRRLVGGILGGLGAIAGGMLNGGDLMRYVSTEGVEMVGSSVAMAGTLYKNKNVADKLAQVPVFLVTNATGQPYLANMEESHQVGLIFFSPKDAEKAWEQMKASPGADDAKIFPMSLDRAMEMVKAKPTPSGLRNESGQDLLMVFRLYPDTEQVSEERWSRKQQPCRSWFLTYVLLRRLCPCFFGGGVDKGEERWEGSWSSQCCRESGSSLCCAWPCGQEGTRIRSTSVSVERGPRKELGTSPGRKPQTAAKAEHRSVWTSGNSRRDGERRRGTA